MQTTAFKQKPKYGKNVCVAACKKREKKTLNFTATKYKIHKKQKWHNWKRRGVSGSRNLGICVYVCESVCCVLHLLVRHKAAEAFSSICVDSEQWLKWSSHTGLRQHNAAPNGAMQKYTETSHQHWSHRLFSKTNRQADRPKPWPPHLIQQVLIHWELKSVHGLHKSQRVRVYLCGRRVQAPGINNNNKVCSRKVHASCLQSLGCPKEGHVHPLICRCTAS